MKQTKEIKQTAKTKTIKNNNNEDITNKHTHETHIMKTKTKQITNKLNNKTINNETQTTNTNK